MFDRDTLQNFIVNTSRQKFSAVTRLVLREIYGLEVTDVDGKGDGAADYIVIPRDGGPRTFVSQVTVQKSGWKNKALRDAETAVREFKCTRYMYLTTRGHESTAFRELENEIHQTHKIPATCLGGREIADMILERGLLSQALDSLDIPVPSSVRDRPDRREILLHAYVALGEEAADLREQVYDDTILLVLRDRGRLSRRDLIGQAVEWLGCDLSREGRFESRIDSLLTRRLLIRDRDGDTLDLSDTSRQSLTNAERVYIAEMDSLASSQASLIEKQFGVAWPTDSARHCAVLLSRAFIKKQLGTLESAGGLPNSLGLLRDLGDPVQELRDYLATANIPVGAVQDVVQEFASNAASLPIIHKLTRSALYALLEGRHPLQTCRSLGVSSWSDVTVIVDASVLIPFLCARLYAPTQGRFSRGALQSINALFKAGARIVTTQDYINETAAHLLKAREYFHFPDAADMLQYSRNGYVEHYFRLRAEGVAVPEDLSGFLTRFSKQLIRQQETQQWIRAIMVDIQGLANQYGVTYEHAKYPGSHVSDVIDREYAYAMRDRGADKLDLLARHDALTLAHMRKIVLDGKSALMCLTWDRLMIAVAKKVGDCGWAVTPHEASDFIQITQRPTGEKLISLSHGLATVRERPGMIVGAILDELAKHAKGNMLDWQMRDRLNEIQSGLLDRINVNDPNFEEWARQQTEAVLESVGIEDSKQVARAVVTEAR